MKTIAKILLIGFLTLMSFNSYSQTKHDNTIIIENVDSTVFSKIKRIIIFDGYEVEDLNASEGYFSTKYHPIEGSVYSTALKVKILGYIEDNKLILTANYTSQFNGKDTAGSAEFFKRKSLVSKNLTFLELERFSKQIKNEIIFTKK